MSFLCSMSVLLLPLCAEIKTPEILINIFNVALNQITDCRFMFWVDMAPKPRAHEHDTERLTNEDLKT